MLLKIYYAFHEIRYTMYITVAGALTNVILNQLLMPVYGALGVAIATVVAGIVQTTLLLFVLKEKLGFTLYLKPFWEFMVRYLYHLAAFIGAFYLLYKLVLTALTYLFPQWLDLLVHHIGLWFWVGPVCLLAVGLLYYLRNKGGLHLYFLE